jgi:hypothetical protein
MHYGQLQCVMVARFYSTPKSVLQKRAACIGTMQFEGLGFPNKHFATQNGLCIYEDTACYGYESLLNCKIIFQLLYWAYQSFFGRTPQ